MNIRFNDEAGRALKEYMGSRENKVIRIKVMARG